MWNYSDKVLEHFYRPRNVGELPDANGIGEVGSIQCGDALRLLIKVDPETEVILDARFQTFGCGSAIASSSALTEMIKGKTLSEALAITNQDIADYLDGLPPEKMHCSVMGREALQAAIANYRGEEWRDEHEEGALVCRCFGVDARLIEETIRSNGLTTVTEVTHYTKAGGGCAACHEAIEAILARVVAERAAGTGSAIIDDAAAPFATAGGGSGTTQVSSLSASATSTGAASVSRPLLTNFQRMRLIMETIEEVRPLLQRDGGDIEVVEVQGRNVFVRLTGACVGCALEVATLGGIGARLFERLGEPVHLIPVNVVENA